MCWEVLIISPPLFLQIGATPVAILLNLKLNVMQECKVFWVGTSKSGNHYVGVSYEVDGFICKSFVGVNADKAATVKVDDEIKVPEAAL